MNRQIRLNIITYTVFLLLATAGIFYGNGIINNYSSLRVWTGINLVLLLSGVPFLFVFRKAGIPDFWQPEISNKTRLGLPFLTGILFGAADVLVFRIILHPEPYSDLPPFAQPFPYSFFLYFSGAFETEVFYRLIPLTIICLAGMWFRKGKYFHWFVCSGAVLTSVREPLEQLQAGELWITAYALLSGFLMNFVQALQFRNKGFIAPLSLRLGHYVVWHIMLGAYIQFIEL